MRHLIFAVVAVAIALAGCSRGSGNTSMQPISVIGCVAQSGSNYVLTAYTPVNRNIVGTSGNEPRRYRLVDEAHAGVDRYVDRQVQINGTLDRSPGQEASMLPTIRVTQLSSLGGCQ